MQYDSRIIKNRNIKGDYFQVDFDCPEICRTALAGQFVHLRIVHMRDRILRRPFSICNTSEKGVLSLVYKIVGEGTQALAEMEPGQQCNLMGPLGKAFTSPDETEFPVIIAGGYGSAATYLLAKSAPRKGLLLLGARSKQDLILTDAFRKTGFDVRAATNDGSEGHHGLVTDLLSRFIEENSPNNVRFFSCGPLPMLINVAKILNSKHLDGELSLDHLMCCGVGACFACVVKVKADNGQGWRYARTCREGPVFSANDVYYE